MVVHGNSSWARFQLQQIKGFVNQYSPPEAQGSCTACAGLQDTSCGIEGRGGRRRLHAQAAESRTATDCKNARSAGAQALDEFAVTSRSKPDARSLKACVFSVCLTDTEQSKLLSQVPRGRLGGLFLSGRRPHFAASRIGARGVTRGSRPTIITAQLRLRRELRCCGKLEKQSDIHSLLR
jgi:hypothetical protein